MESNVWQYVCVLVNTNTDSAFDRQRTFTIYSQLHTSIQTSRVNEQCLLLFRVLCYQSRRFVWSKWRKERESEFESSFQESQTAIRLVNQTFGVNELLLLLLVVPLVIYKNIYRGSFDCVGAKINAPQKANRFRFISMVTKHSFPFILHGLWRLVQLFFRQPWKRRNTSLTSPKKRGETKNIDDVFEKRLVEYRRKFIPLRFSRSQSNWTNVFLFTNSLLRCSANRRRAKNKNTQ